MSAGGWIKLPSPRNVHLTRISDIKINIRRTHSPIKHRANIIHSTRYILKVRTLTDECIIYSNPAGQKYMYFLSPLTIMFEKSSFCTFTYVFNNSNVTSIQFCFETTVQYRRNQGISHVSAPNVGVSS